MPEIPVPIWGSGNVWLEHDLDTTTQDRIDEAVALGLGAVRVAGGQYAVTGELPQVNKGINVLNACAEAGLRVLFGFVLDYPGDEDPFGEGEVPGAEPPATLPTPEDIFNGGAAWGAMVAVHPHADLVLGFSIQNEFDGKIKRVYDQVLATPSSHANALTAAQARAAWHAEVIREFCRGVRFGYEDAAEAAYPGILTPGGMAQPERSWARVALLPLVPDLLDGLGDVPPLLTGIGLHWYKENANFSFDLDFSTNPPTVTAELIDEFGASLAERTTELLSDLFEHTPSVIQTLPVYVQECNVRRTSFGTPVSNPNKVAKTKAALRAVLDGLRADVRCKLIFPYSPWAEDLGEYPTAYDDYLISLVDPFGSPLLPSPTPSAVVLLEYTMPDP